MFAAEVRRELERSKRPRDRFVVIVDGQPFEVATMQRREDIADGWHGVEITLEPVTLPVPAEAPRLMTREQERQLAEKAKDAARVDESGRV